MVRRSSNKRASTSLVGVLKYGLGMHCAEEGGLLWCVGCPQLYKGLVKAGIEELLVLDSKVLSEDV